MKITKCPHCANKFSVPDPPSKLVLLASVGSGLFIAGLAFGAVVALLSGGRGERIVTVEKPVEKVVTKIVEKPVERIVTKIVTVEKPVERIPEKVVPKETPAAVAGKREDVNAKRLKQLDAKAMNLLRTGKLKDGFNVIIDAVAPYKNRRPEECSPEESLMVAVLYVRIGSLLGRSASEDELLAFTGPSVLHAMRGGITESQYPLWFNSILDETVKAANTAK